MKPDVLFGIAVILALFVVPVLTRSTFGQGAAALAALDMIATMSVCVLFGWSGQFMFAQGAIFGTSAYISAYMVIHGMPSIVAVIAGTLGGAVVGMTVVVAASRLSRLQVGLITFALGMAAIRVFATVSGFNGLAGIASYSFAGWKVDTTVRELGLACFALFLVYISTKVVRGRRLGRRMLLMKWSPDTLASLGVSPLKIRLAAFGVGSLMLGFGGSLYPAMTSYINPNAFDIDFVISLLLGAVIGGLIMLEGGLVGGLIVAILPALLEAHASIFNFADGLIVVAILILLPAGIVVTVAKSRFRLKKRAGAITAVKVELTSEPQRELRTVSTFEGRVTRSTGSANNATGHASLLEVEQVSKSFAGLQALEDVSLTVSVGERLGLIGSNGAGKSTLVNVLTGYEAAEPGASIRIAGTEVKKKTPAFRSRLGLTRTFQFPSFAEELTVLENVNLGLRDNTRESAEFVDQVLRVAELESMADQMVIDLPFGIQKLIDVCRAVVMRPKILFLDEPAAGMGRHELPLLSSVFELASSAGIALVVVEHNMEFLMGIAERIVVLDFGRIMAVGTPAEIAADPEVQGAYLGMVVPESHGDVL